MIKIIKNIYVKKQKSKKLNNNYSKKTMMKNLFKKIIVNFRKILIQIIQTIHIINKIKRKKINI